MDQKPSVAKLPDFIEFERHGEVVRLSWANRSSHPRSLIFEAMLGPLMLVLSFWSFLAESRSKAAWILLVGWIFGGLVGLFMALAALRWFWVETIELRPDTLTLVFHGPLAPRRKEFRRSAIVNIRISCNSDADDPLLRLTHRGPFIHRQELIGHYLRPEHLQVLEIYLRAWLARPGAQARKYPGFSDLDE